MKQNAITVQTVIDAPIEKIWEYWTKPDHVVKWAFASDDWCAPRAENDLRSGGSFTTRMESVDGSQGFDFSGVYSNVKEPEYIAYTMDDGREVEIRFSKTPKGVEIIQTFDPEDENSLELQQSGWQAILDNFKAYVQKKTGAN